MFFGDSLVLFWGRPNGVLGRHNGVLGESHWGVGTLPKPKKKAEIFLAFLAFVIVFLVFSSVFFVFIVFVVCL